MHPAGHQNVLQSRDRITSVLLLCTTQRKELLLLLPHTGLHCLTVAASQLLLCNVYSIRHRTLSRATLHALDRLCTNSKNWSLHHNVPVHTRFNREASQSPFLAEAGSTRDSVQRLTGAETALSEAHAVNPELHCSRSSAMKCPTASRQEADPDTSASDCDWQYTFRHRDAIRALPARPILEQRALFPHPRPKRRSSPNWLPVQLRMSSCLHAF